jgi:hypothetical protein
MTIYFCASAKTGLFEPNLAENSNRVKRAKRNGPNFMVKSIAEHAGVKMPSFFGYLAWSLGILVPVFLMVPLLFFR